MKVLLINIKTETNKTRLRLALLRVTPVFGRVLYTSVVILIVGSNIAIISCRGIDKKKNKNKKRVDKLLTAKQLLIKFGKSLNVEYFT